MLIQDPDTHEEVINLVQDMEDITGDVSHYFHYHVNRQPIINDLLSESSQN